MVVIAVVYMLPMAVAAPKDEEVISSKCPTFDGITANFVTWLISFTAWVAWKAPELVPILNMAARVPPLCPMILIIPLRSNVRKSRSGSSAMLSCMEHWYLMLQHTFKRLFTSRRMEMV